MQEEVSHSMTVTEGRICDLEDQLPPLAHDARKAAQQVATADTKTDDSENCLRRNNVRIVGLPKKVEGRKPHSFCGAVAAGALQQGCLYIPLRSGAGASYTTETFSSWEPTLVHAGPHVKLQRS